MAEESVMEAWDDDAIADKVIEIVKNVLAREIFDADILFHDYGLDDLDLCEIHLDIEMAFDIALPISINALHDAGNNTTELIASVKELIRIKENT